MGLAGAGGGTAVEGKLQCPTGIDGHGADAVAIVSKTLTRRQCTKQATIGEEILAIGTAVARNGDRGTTIVAIVAVEGIKFAVRHGDITIDDDGTAIL